MIVIKPINLFIRIVGKLWKIQKCFALINRFSCPNDVTDAVENSNILQRGHRSQVVGRNLFRKCVKRIKRIYHYEITRERSLGSRQYFQSAYETVSVCT